MSLPKAMNIIPRPSRAAVSCNTDPIWEHGSTHSSRKGKKTALVNLTTTRSRHKTTTQSPGDNASYVSKPEKARG